MTASHVDDVQKQYSVIMTSNILLLNFATVHVSWAHHNGQLLKGCC